MRKWESRIRNRNFWARCSCNRVILHSCRGSGRAGSGTGTSGLAVLATELSFIHAEEVGEQDQEQVLLGSLLLQQSYPSLMQRKWESRIRNRNFWARCFCNRVIIHSNRTWKSKIRIRNSWTPYSFKTVILHSNRTWKIRIRNRDF